MVGVDDRLRGVNGELTHGELTPWVGVGRCNSTTDQSSDLSLSPCFKKGMVEGSLGDCLSKGSGDNEDTIKKLCALLLAVDRLSTIERLYCSAKLAAVQASWDELAASGPKEGGEALGWLPRFLSWLTTFLEQVGGLSIRGRVQSQGGEETAIAL